MKAFSVTRNGKHRCVAGVGADGVLHVIAAWAGRASHRQPDDIFLSVGGLKNDQHLRWIKQEKLAVGDEIVIRVVETKNADRPIASSRRANRAPNNTPEPIGAKRASGSA